MAYKNCWKNCTPLETGLGLGLIVSVAFLLVMIVVYLSGDTTISTIFGPKYYSCKKACECLTDFTKLLFFPLHPDIERELPKDLQPFFVRRALKSQLHPTFCLGKNYSIGAIVQQRYADNLEYFEFIASAAILSSKWLLSYTSLDDSTPDSVYAAVGSKYWSKSGYIHKVQTTIPLNELILLKLKADIIINMEFVKLLGPTDVQTVSVTTWNPAYKHKTALETNLSVISSAHYADGTFCTDVDPNIEDKEMLSTLAIYNNTLLGFYNSTFWYQNKYLYKFKSIQPYILYIMLNIDQ